MQDLINILLSCQVVAMEYVEVCATITRARNMDENVTARKDIAYILLLPSEKFKHKLENIGILL